MKLPTEAHASPPLSVHEKVDISRGLFAALVVVAHAQYVAWGIHPEARDSLSPLARDLIISVIGMGIIYVMGFFVVSGYCIHLSVSRLAQKGPFPLGSYLVARASRILPLYYLGLLLAVAVEWWIADARPHVWPNGVTLTTLAQQVAVIQNLTETYGSYAPTWSITNEAFYYIFYGLIVAACAGRSTARPAWVGLALCLATAIVTQALYATVARTPLVYGLGMLLGLGMIWFWGVLVAVHGATLIRIPGVKLLTRTWPILVVGVMAWQYAGLPLQGLYLISGVAFTLMLLGFLDAPPAPASAAKGTRRAWIIETLGLMSYPMYLVHGPLMLLVGSCILRWRWIDDWRITFVVLTVVGLGSGVALGWLVEKPLMARRAAWLKRLDNGSKRAVGSAPVAAPTAVRPATLGSVAR
ncbi:MAG: acyltransferase [Isosphaeraceae bacterium]